MSLFDLGKSSILLFIVLLSVNASPYKKLSLVDLEKLGEQTQPSTEFDFNDDTKSEKTELGNDYFDWNYLSKKSLDMDAFGNEAESFSKYLNRPMREMRETRSNMDRYRQFLKDLVRKNSLYNTLPIDAELFDRYMNEYVNNVEKRLSANKKETFANSQKLKRAACGNLNGNPMHRWICW